MLTVNSNVHLQHMTIQQMSVFTIKQVFHKRLNYFYISM